MKNKSLLLLVFYLFPYWGHGQLFVTGGNSAAALVDSLVGIGVTVTNISYTGNPASKGTYRCTGGCNLGSPRGIFLTTGNAGSTPTTPVSNFHSYDMGTDGDAQLDLLVSPDSTCDATVLEFDFTPATDSIGFKFIFGSEEYNEYVGFFNDVFAFYISGPGIPGGTKNIALVPGTSLPVSINNVNNGYNGGLATGPCTNCLYYFDNMAGGTGSIFFDGFTVPMYAGIRVLPCQTYHMKFAVADVNDHVFDSGVFLEANQFSSVGTMCITVDGQAHCNDTIQVCKGDSILLTAYPSNSYVWSTGDTTQSITVSQPGNYTIINLFPSSCFSTNHITIINDSITSVPSIIQSSDTLFSSVTSASYSYQWMFNGLPISGANSFQLIISQLGCYVLSITDSNHLACSPVSDTLCVVSLSYHEIEFSDKGVLFPNPILTDAVLSFKNPLKEIYSLKIFDALGNLVRSMDAIKSNSVTIEKGNLGNGVYFYELLSDGHKTIRGKFMIK